MTQIDGVHVNPGTQEHMYKQKHGDDETITKEPQGQPPPQVKDEATAEATRADDTGMGGIDAVLTCVALGAPA